MVGKTNTELVGSLCPPWALGHGPARSSAPTASPAPARGSHDRSAGGSNITGGPAFHPAIDRRRIAAGLSHHAIKRGRTDTPAERRRKIEHRVEHGLAIEMEHRLAGDVDDGRGGRGRLGVEHGAPEIVAGDGVEQRRHPARAHAVTLRSRRERGEGRVVKLSRRSWRVYRALCRSARRRRQLA
jgi:hypothetical protein